MFKFTKIAIVVVILSIASKVCAQQDSKSSDKIKWSEAFESDSEFMKGFETGIFIRTKGGTPEDYGCSFIEEGDDAISAGIEAIRNAIIGAKAMLPDEPLI